MRVGLLQGIRVVELGAFWAAPYAARILGDLGAEVIKVEAPRRPEPVRYSLFLDSDPGEKPWERGAHFQKFSRNKLSCVIDLQQPRGRELFDQLLDTADVLIENNTPRVRQQLNLTTERLRERFPRLVVVSMPGFGLDGPYRDYVAYGINLEGFTGISSVTGYGDGTDPVRSTVPMGDPVAGLYAVFAALAGLRNRKRSGEGVRVELSQHEALATMLPDLFIRAQVEGESPRDTGNGDGFLRAPQGLFEASEPGTWVAVSVDTAEAWQALCRLIRREDLSALTCPVERDIASVRDALAAWVRQRTRDEAVAGLQELGIPAGPSLSPREMIEHEQVVARGVYEDVPHPLNRAMPYARLPIRFEGIPGAGDRHAPLFGDGNDYVFKTLLGLGGPEVDELYARQVTAREPVM